MPNRVKRNSVVDLLAKVPVNRGSLLNSIENLLKTIETSENAVMIPTLLRDKCEFDAWELLFVAKILKASILGHSDLVEFYMNHIGHTSNHFSHQSNGNYADPQQQNSLSPSTIRQSSPISSPVDQQPNGSLAQVLNNSNTLPTSPSISSTSSLNSATTTHSSNINLASNKNQSTTNWIATNGGQQSGSVSGSVSSSSAESTLNGDSQSSSGFTSSSSNQDTIESSIQESLLAARPLLMRQAQPPSLLQLTTTNNHINSVAAVAFTNSNIEQLTNQLTATQANGCLSGSNGSTNGLDGTLSISTTTANQQSAPGINGSHASAAANGNGTPTSSVQTHPELRSSRSAGCLFRMNSGASSPRTPAQTPTTPYPQAETLANGFVNGLPVDPSTPVKLLLQIEQLKSSIGNVTSLLESVVELYKKSIDDIAVS